MARGTLSFQPSSEVGEIRGRLGHQVIDGDGHLAEFMPWVFDIVRDIGGSDVERRLKRLSFGSAEPGSGAMPVRTYHTVPARNTLDRMTTMLPELHYRRLDEFGIDFALLYPSYGLLAMSALDREVRQVGARALNTYAAAAYDGLRDRLEPVAVIPCFTPDEAIDELEHAVGALGLKAIVLTGVIPRSHRRDGVAVPWIDTLGHDSAHDYDPVWVACERLYVTPAFHGIGYGWGAASRRRTTSTTTSAASPPRRKRCAGRWS
jgi:predicted TIM-barrel fold metal-dependent hydrolase